ncbi:hypothetical protein RB195_023438 [Necator americanus]|uniref:Integrase catalytic domain-containing protein n=1 Tax=Necator americanus TaxID=51031 RepID=A0ABR1EJ68_NECAM
MVILKPLEHRVLSTLHKAHPGQTRMEMLASSFVFGFRHRKTRKDLSRMRHTRVHADFAGPMEGRYHLLIVDVYSKWLEIVYNSSIFSTATIRAMKCIFAKFRNPETIADNGTEFTSPQFTSFCRSRGILHTRTPPFYPQNNGQAERFVDSFKRGLGKLKREEPTMDALQTFLLANRSTPCPSAPDQRSPVKTFLGRRLRTDTDLMLPSRDLTNDYRGQKPTWIPGFITRRVGNTTYTVRCGKEVWTQHVNQLRSRIDTTATNIFFDVFDLPPLDSASEDDIATPTVDSSQRPQRLRRPRRQLQVVPQRTRYEITWKVLYDGNFIMLFA